MEIVDMAFTEQDLQMMQARLERKSPTGVPLKDALIDDVDADAVDAGEEIALHMEIIKECRRRGWLYVYSNPSRKATNQLGTPDFIILAPRADTLFIECKTRTGTLTKEQKEFKRRALAAGHKFFVVRSMKRFQEILNLELVGK